MSNRLKTSSKTMKIFEKIGQATGLQPFALSKISLALSLSSKQSLSENDFLSDSLGLDLNKQTICGEYELVFDLLIQKSTNFTCTRYELFPKFYKAHIDRGARLLENEFRYDKHFYRHLSELKKGI